MEGNHGESDDASLEHIADTCAICSESLGHDRVKLYDKGLASLIHASEVRNDGKLHQLLTRAEAGPVLVHQTCRRQYTGR